MLSHLAPLGFGILFVAVVGFIIFAGISAAKAAKARREALQALGNEIGFSFTPDDDRELPSRLSIFGTFSRGSDRRAYNTLSGTTTVNGRPVAVRLGDYRFTTESGSGKDRRETTHHLSYLAARLPYPLAGRLAVRRENFFDKIGGAIGFEDINFESAEFSKTFHVKGDDRKFVYDLFDPRMIEWFMSSSPPTLETIGPDLLLTQGGTWKPEEFRARFDWLRAFLERWPTHVVDRLSTKAPIL